MRKVWIIPLLMLLFTGCAAQETFETLEDELPVVQSAVPWQFYVSLPEEAAAPTFQDDTGTELYVCEGYTVSKQITPAGDLEKTVKQLTGKATAELQLLKTRDEACDRYDFVWTCAGEEGLQVGRACILDDGNYHYILSTLAQESVSGQLREVFSEMYESCKLLDPEINLRTGS